MRRELAFERLNSLRGMALPEKWRRPLSHLAIAWVGLIALFAQDWATMARQWWDISTYNHILLVPPIVAWLVKLRAAELAQLDPRAWWPGLLLGACACFAWLLGNVSGVNTASQLGAVLALQAAVLTLLGPQVARGLLFPLAYLLFLVPVGDELVPTLQMVTAAMVIWLTHASGIPAEIEGVFIDTPVGLFEVAEACSGVKFLIAMIALGALVAHVCYRSALRRTLFMALAVAIPVIANGIRAWGTIYIAQYQGVEFAEGFDHVFYGWVFFAIVLALLLAAGWRWFERWPDDSYIDPQAVKADRWVARLEALDRGRVSEQLALALLLATGVVALSWGAVAGSRMAALPERIALPAVPGWQLVDYAPGVPWEPRATGADHRLLGRYRNAEGAEVDVFFALYASQGEGREAGGFGEGALMPDTPWRWSQPTAAPEGGKGEWLQAYLDTRRYAATWYRRGDLLTGSNAQLKLAGMLGRLALQARPTMLLVLSSEHTIGDSRDPAAAVADFRRATGPLDAWMDAIGEGR